ncbi:hypothetical protein H5410_026091, partial [Solanum commersonii]
QGLCLAIQVDPKFETRLRLQPRQGHKIVEHTYTFERIHHEDYGGRNNKPYRQVVSAGLKFVVEVDTTTYIVHKGTTCFHISWGTSKFQKVVRRTMSTPYRHDFEKDYNMDNEILILCKEAQIFILPNQILQRVEIMCKRFIWNGEVQAKREAFIAWDTLC